MTIIRSTIAAALAASACLAAAPVSAMDPGREVVRVRIVHADLNLADTAGRATLQSRIDRAVRHACRPSQRGLSAIVDAARCRAEMLRDADVQVAAIKPRASVELAARR